MNTYNEYYRENIIPNLMEQLKLKSPMEVPKLLKITLNMGLGSAVSDKKILESAQQELTQISGQKAVLTYAFASEAVNNFTIPEVKELAQKLIAEKLQVDLDFNL